MNPLDSFPTERLTRAEEDAIAKSKKPEELEKLVLHNIREAVTYARRICDKFGDDELISICYDVLNRGAKRFKPGWVRFFAFCKPGIRGYVRRHWRQKDVVKGAVPTEAEKPPTPKAGVTEGLEPWDDAAEVTPEHEVQEADFASILTRERWALCEGIINRRCNEREKAVLKLCYEGGFNFPEIAKMLGVTRTAIQGTHAVALRKIRVVLFNKRRLFND